MLLVSMTTKAQRPLQSGVIVSQGRCVDAIRALQRENSDSVAVAQLFRYYKFDRDTIPAPTPQQWRKTYKAIMDSPELRCVLKSESNQQVLLP